ncbi:MAG TPA: DUF2141 domain-containing protein [Terracidiphilus sp.]|nr:DUF2141 domain-containing protein [Terracidiphilus sp.]
MFAAILMLLSSVLPGTSSANGAQNVIHVDIDGLRADKGQVVCSLYSSAEGFPKKPQNAIAQSKSPVANHHSECTFSGIQSGTYAISVFHDENSNNRLDTNFLGIPREGVGASNNAKGCFGPPNFHDASVTYTGGRLDLQISIVYL